MRARRSGKTTLRLLTEQPAADHSYDPSVGRDLMASDGEGRPAWNARLGYAWESDYGVLGTSRCLMSVDERGIWLIDAELCRLAYEASRAATTEIAGAL